MTKVPQKDQQSARPTKPSLESPPLPSKELNPPLASGITKVTPQYGAQVTLQYKTFLKRTIQEALQNAFALYTADYTLEKTKIGVNYQTERVNFPNIVVKFYEKSLRNAGVGHIEWGRTNEIEKLRAKNAILDGHSGTLSGLATTGLFYPGKTVVVGPKIPKETYVSKIISKTVVQLSQLPEESVVEDVTFEDVFTERFLPYHHYIYHGDIGLEVYGMSSQDRDKVVDAVVEVVAMGNVGEEGLSFQNRIYETIEASNFPYSEWHFPVVNTDILTGYGENQEIAPWMPEDTWVYKNEQRFEVMGEFYSITPETPEGSLELLQEVLLYPWSKQDTSTTPPEDFPNGEIPLEDYIPITKHVSKGRKEVTPEGSEIFLSTTGYRKEELQPSMSLTVSMKPHFKEGSTGLKPKKGLFPKKGLHPEG